MTPWHQYKILSWNVRGLNNSTKQEDVKQIINSVKPDIVCLQETKLAAINQSTIKNVLGHDYDNSFAFLPAVGTKGGILLAGRDSLFSICQCYHYNGSGLQKASIMVDDCCVWASGGV
jgi:DNA phosphorothioation-dependent restriction protein DptG